MTVGYVEQKQPNEKISSEAFWSSFYERMKWFPKNGIMSKQ